MVDPVSDERQNIAVSKWNGVLVGLCSGVFTPNFSIFFVFVRIRRIYEVRSSC